MSIECSDYKGIRNNYIFHKVYDMKCLTNSTLACSIQKQIIILLYVIRARLQEHNLMCNQSFLIHQDK